MTRRRADQLLVARGFFASRAKAQEAIAAGLVQAGGRPVTRPAELVDAEAEIEAAAPYPWVSRGGVKLAAALDHFAIDPRGLVCLDLGASTGGFTDVLLTRGAGRVHAVDVGHGQLHPRLAADPCVVAYEGRDARSLTPALLGEPVELAVIDVSFISLALVVPALPPLCAPDARLVALIKPQFEAGRAHVRKGLVRDTRVHETVRRDVAAALTQAGFAVHGSIPSPIAGGDGNREYLIAADRREAVHGR
ncbi:TlyA family RNA methyltransferase [Chelatococcus reniformis]|uniref:TlyA family rRNA (Cytidine-2'-O)-methyltransferase n=1 Tax=Chelatococcus reniformis TaxID=1494448 RepID=A0A916U8K4_9HYPH|nr:TlyA family RNA methyltransferase [Chelatococcus reniformis]GGC62022.1 TlyA family rRNA (cytidine-2'-O)-methyltransferase [Chelatococcus reniformis]